MLSEKICRKCKETIKPRGYLEIFWKGDKEVTCSRKINESQASISIQDGDVPLNCPYRLEHMIDCDGDVD